MTLALTGTSGSRPRTSSPPCSGSAAVPRRILLVARFDALLLLAVVFVMTAKPFSLGTDEADRVAGRRRSGQFSCRRVDDPVAAVLAVM
jgi:hypothetical protein